MLASLHCKTQTNNNNQNIKKMNKLIISVFNDEERAAQGLEELKTLHQNGDISIYATAVLKKNNDGEVELKQSSDQGPLGTAIGGLTGALVGMFAGPAGMAAGTLAGMYGGMFYDIDKSYFDVSFIQEASDALEAGKTAVIIDADEEWTAPLDAKINAINGEVYRKNRTDVEDDQLRREAKELNKEIDELENEMKEANEETKESIQKQLDKAKAKNKALKEKIDTRLEKQKAERKAKMEKLNSQLANAQDSAKKKLEKRKAELKESNKASKKKLSKVSKKISTYFT